MFTLLWFVLMPLLSVGVVGAAEVSTSQTQCGGLWSANSTWSTNGMPQAGDFVQINAGCTVIYDLASSPNLAEINIEGSLVFALNKDTKLSVSLLIVEPTGKLEIGTLAQPLPPQFKARIDLVDMPEQAHTHMHGQANIAPALHTHGGTLTLVGAEKVNPWTKLSVDTAVGATTITVQLPITDWQAGHTVIIGTEEATIQSVSGLTITLTAPLVSSHKSQDVVAVLNRNIQIVSATPAGRRGHVMVAHGFVVKDSDPLPVLNNQVKATIQGVQFAHLGRPEPGIYPIHFHRLGNGGKDVVFRGNSIHASQNLCVRVHTTNLMTVRDNVCYDAIGHGFALEDGTEMFNVFINNAAIKTRKSLVKTNPNDTTDINEGSGFWFNNPMNSLFGNIAVANEGWGFQVDPATVGVNPIVGKIVPTIDITGMSQGSKSVTALPLGVLIDNVSQHSVLGGMEVTNLNGSSPYMLDRFTSTGTGQHAIQTFIGGQTTIKGLNTDVSVGLYDPGNFEGIALSLVHTLILESQIKNLILNYQLTSSISLEKTPITSLARTSINIGSTLVVSRDQMSTPQALQLNMQQFAPNTTTQHELLFYHANGLGQHLKLIPGTAVSTDNLTYRKSRFFPNGGWPIVPDQQGLVTAYQEAPFTGTVGVSPPLKLPFRVRAGIQPKSGDDWMTSTDLIDASARRWRVANPYVKGPPGTTIARYGISQMFGPTATGSMFRTGALTDLYGAVAVTRGYSTAFKPMTFTFDLPDGIYHVDLHFIEQWAGLPDNKKVVGGRVFSVTANGKPMVSNLDVFKEVGLAKPLVKSADMSITGKQLVLSWGPYGMISAISVCLPSQVVSGRCS
jgi:hypothetical protein